MTEVIIMGKLSKIYGNSIKLNVGNINFLINALDAIKNGFKKTLFNFIENGYNYTLEKIKNKFYLIPLLGGSGKTFRLILGVVLIIVGVILMFIPGAQGLGFSLITSGVTLLFYEDPKFPKISHPDQSTGGFSLPSRAKGSSIFQNMNNVASQGSLVPLGYGQSLLSSKIIIASLKNYEIGQTIQSESFSNLVEAASSRFPIEDKLIFSNIIDQKTIDELKIKNGFLKNTITATFSDGRVVSISSTDQQDSLDVIVVPATTFTLTIDFETFGIVSNINYQWFEKEIKITSDDSVYKDYKVNLFLSSTSYSAVAENQFCFTKTKAINFIKDPNFKWKNIDPFKISTNGGSSPSSVLALSAKSTLNLTPYGVSTTNVTLTSLKQEFIKILVEDYFYTTQDATTYSDYLTIQTRSQWFFNGEAIYGAVFDKLTIPSVNLRHAGSYMLVRSYSIPAFEQNMTLASINLINKISLSTFKAVLDKLISKNMIFRDTNPSSYVVFSEKAYSEYLQLIVV